jgi:hypothetical protein
MYVRVREIDNGAAATGQAGEKLLELIEPAIARGEVVELDFEGVWIYAALFFYCSVGRLIEADTTERVPPLLRYANLSERGQADLEWGVEFAVRRRENPRWAAGAGAAAEKMAERE